MAVKAGWEGRFFEDFEVGDVYRCRLGQTVTETDNTWFTLLTNNPNQLHFNNEYGKRTEFGKCLINSALTLAIVAGLGVADVSENGFALGEAELAYGVEPSNPAIGSAVTTTDPNARTISFGSILELDDIRVGVQNFEVRFGSSTSFSGGIFIQLLRAECR